VAVLPHRLGAIGGTQLLHDPLHLILHRERADGQDLGDFRVGPAFGHPLEDLLLAPAQGTGFRSGLPLDCAAGTLEPGDPSVSGVDPYYLTNKAEMLGYLPLVIIAGRRINDRMGKFIGEQTVKQMIPAGSFSMTA